MSILDRVTDGLTVVAEALTASATSGERWYNAELHRLKGELLLKQTDSTEHRSRS